MNHRGRFVTVEGAEGVGKTTHVRTIEQRLAAAGIDVVRTREPGGTPLAEEIRETLATPRQENIDVLAETLLVFAARAQHVAAVIEPALRSGKWVLCDRFTDSTFAYQCGGRGVSEALVETLATEVHGHCWPDVTFFLDAPVSVGLGRISGREADRFESEDAAFFERVRSVFADRARRHARIVKIDASDTLERVDQALASALNEFLAGARHGPDQDGPPTCGGIER